VYSTFNCFCVYNSKPFIDGLRWGFLNKRLNASDIKLDSGYLDADTSIMCEQFRALGYNNIFINRNCLVRHL